MLSTLAAATADPASSPQVIGAVWAASIAAFVGLVNVLLTLVQGHYTREAAAKLGNREQWWSRFTWAAEELFDPNEARSDVAATVLESLADVDWITNDDRDMVFKVLNKLTSDVPDEEIEEALGGSNP